MSAVGPAGPEVSAAVHRVDAWWTVLAVDPIAIPLVRLVTPWAWVTPMRLTVTAHLLGLLTAGLFAAGHLVIAAVLYEIRFVLDCMDGKLARRRRTTSAVGAHLDFVGDYVITTANLAGLGLWATWHAGTSPALALAPAVVFALHMAVRLSTEMQEGEMWRAVEAMPGRYVRWMAARRLVPAPSRVDVEHGCLFVVPLLWALIGDDAVVEVAAAVVAAYFAYVMLRFFRGGLSLAAARDRADRAEPGGAA